MSNKNLTKTLFADFRKVDTKKLNINGNPFSKVKDAREVITENDLWANSVTTDENGVVTVTQGATIDGTNWADINGYDKKQYNDGTNTITKVENNKAYDGDTFLFNIETNAIEKGTKMFYVSELASWDGDLSSLTDGSQMFRYTNLASFNGNLSNLTDGDRMFFYCTNIASFNGDLSSLIDGQGMFSYCTDLASFSGDLSSLTNGSWMFRDTNLTSFNGDLSNLTDGQEMFYNTPLTSFNNDLSSLTNGENMFYRSPLESFNSDLSSLTNGKNMFYGFNLASWDTDLPNLTDGNNMFHRTPLTSFNHDLSNLTNGQYMFYMTALESFNGDLSSLTNGTMMFYSTHERTFTILHCKIVNGEKKLVETPVTSTGLKSFISNLSSLKSGYYMFGNSSTTCSPLDEESIMLIADTINDISNNSDWTYTTCDSDGNLTTSTIYLDYRGKLHLGYDSSITDKTNIFKYCDEIVAKGWTVYLNGSSTPYTPSNPAALIDDESTSTPIPHYYKPVQVTDEEIAEYVDGNGNLFIIIGAQHVFGDDINNYGIFTSHDDAVTQITSSLGLTPYVKPTEETTEK